MPARRNPAVGKAYHGRLTYRVVPASYEISVLPGPGALAVTTQEKMYISAAVDADRLREITGLSKARPRQILSLQTAAGGQAMGIMGLNEYQGVVLVNPPEDSDALTVEIAVIPSRSRMGTIVDDRGKPISNVDVVGLGASATTVTPLESPEFQVEGLAPGRQRILYFLHTERELGARLVVSGDEMAPLRVELLPTGVCTGRFVDEFGEPMSDVRLKLMVEYPPGSMFSITGFWEATANKDGRFRIPGLIDGVSYALQGRVPEQLMLQLVQLHVNAESGETVDLGVFKDDHRFTPVGQ